MDELDLIAKNIIWLHIRFGATVISADQRDDFQMIWVYYFHILLRVTVYGHSQPSPGSISMDNFRQNEDQEGRPIISKSTFRTVAVFKLKVKHIQLNIYSFGSKGHRFAKTLFRVKIHDVEERTSLQMTGSQKERSKWNISDKNCVCSH